MSNGAQTFGAHLAATPFVERFSLHAAEGDRRELADYDRVLAGLFTRAIRGESIVDVELATRRTDNDVVRLKIDEDEREVLASVLAPHVQQGRGAWYVPDADKPRIGMVEFARWSATEPRFSISAADAQRAAVRLDTPDAVAVWAALEPVIDLLYLPLKLRSGHWLGDRRPDQMEKDWARVDATYGALAIDTSPLNVFKDGRRWATLNIAQVIAARRALVEAWGSAPSDVGERAIVLLISRLVERYYLKAKDGKAQRTQVMNKGLERVLSGTFGGDWLALVVRPVSRLSHAASTFPVYVQAKGLAVRL